jgi:hypothetical protein
LRRATNEGTVAATNIQGKGPSGFALRPAAVEKSGFVSYLARKLLRGETYA